MLDAVHYAPHFPIDVEALKPDFLLCSAYKFYGPHVGILYSRDGLLDQLETDRLRTQESLAPYRIETGTLNHAAIVGVKAAVEYIASFGTGSDLRSKIVSAMQLIAQYEHSVAEVLYEGLQRIEGVTIYGPSIDVPRRAPTISFTLKSKNPVEEIVDGESAPGTDTSMPSARWKYSAFWSGEVSRESGSRCIILLRR